jgi:2-keto-4-pentenoate hydratase/2-oxohepta-3-ene-1,7-dioic acid hydratase in catechol pathway
MLEADDMQSLIFTLSNKKTISLNVKKSVCIGYSGRNQEMVKKHIDELAHEGIPAPPEVPMVYPISNLLVTQSENVQILGEQTSGEVEFVILVSPAGKYLTVGSDHTDRKLEAVSIPYAKQVCPKPVATEAWLLEEVLPHWDQLLLTCEVEINNKWELYQEGSVSAVLPVQEILQFAQKRHCIEDNGTVLFCGTVPIVGGKFKYGSAYRLTINDPILGRSIQHTYKVQNISAN